MSQSATTQLLEYRQFRETNFEKKYAYILYILHMVHFKSWGKSYEQLLFTSNSCSAKRSVNFSVGTHIPDTDLVAQSLTAPPPRPPFLSTVSAGMPLAWSGTKVQPHRQTKRDTIPNLYPLGHDLQQLMPGNAEVEEKGYDNTKSYTIEQNAWTPISLSAQGSGLCEKPLVKQGDWCCYS